MSNLIQRFDGATGRDILIEALLEQQLVGGNRDLANEFAEKGDLVEVSDGDQLITQGAEDNDLYLIIAGSFRVLVNGREVSRRGRGAHVGEMAVVEPTQRRAASVIATEPAILLKLPYPVVTEIASRRPEIYRVMAKVLARRLLERNRLIGQHREQVKVFVISSVESLPIARMIQSALAHDPFTVTVWTDGVFKAGGYAMDDLEAQVDDSDFAIAIAHSDDQTMFRGQDWPTPRDNVVFELGLFMGRLGRKRAILMEPSDDKVKLPSDLRGVTTIGYVYEEGKDQDAKFAPACNILRRHINEYGAFNG